MMHHTQIAQRVFNTPLMVDPAKALAFLTGLGPRITGREISVEGVKIASEAQEAASLLVRASLFGDDLTNRQARNGGQPFAVVHGIAVIEIAGTLVHRGAWIGQSSGLTSYEGIAAQLQAALADPAIRGMGHGLPFANAEGGHQAANSEKSNWSFTRQRSRSAPKSSAAIPGGAARRRASRNRDGPCGPSPRTAATFDQSS